MDVQINPDAMAALVSKAILEGIDNEQRNLLLEQAVTALVTPVKNERWSTDPGKTPLQEAFARAAQVVVNKVAMELVEANEEFAARVRDLIGEAIAVAAESDYGLKEKVGRAVADALLEWKRDR